jgi:hypothetical protein
MFSDAMRVNSTFALAKPCTSAAPRCSRTAGRFSCLCGAATPQTLWSPPPLTLTPPSSLLAAMRCCWHCCVGAGAVRDANLPPARAHGDGRGVRGRALCRLGAHPQRHLRTHCHPTGALSQHFTSWWLCFLYEMIDKASMLIAGWGPTLNAAYILARQTGAVLRFNTLFHLWFVLS